MTAFDTDQGSNLPLLANAEDIIDGIGHFQIVGIAFDEMLDDVDLLQRQLDGILSTLNGHVSRPELGTDATSFKSRNVGVDLFLFFGNVDEPERKVLVRAKLPGQIIMPIDEDRLPVNRLCIIGQNNGLPQGRLRSDNSRRTN